MADVGCAGILVADTFAGPMRALPVEGELVSVDAMRNRAGGCAANVAIDLSKQGVAVDVAGRVGADSAARLVTGALEQNRIGCDRILVSEKLPTSTTVILLVEGEDRRYIHSFGANQEFSAADIDLDWLQHLKLFYVGGLFAMPSLRIADLASLLKRCREAGVITVVDVVIPGGRDVRNEIAPLLPLVDWIMPNDDEAKLLTGESDPRRQAQALRRGGAGGVVITRGKDGALVVVGERCWECGVYDGIAPLDPSGSGDAFAAGFIVGLLQKWGMPQTLRFASATGGSATRAVGTTDGVFTRDEALAFVESHPLRVIEGRLAD